MGSQREFGVGIVGLGAASALVLPYLNAVPGVRLRAAAEVRTEAREAFQQRFGLPADESVAKLCRRPDIDIVWIETPNHLHCDHTLEAISYGKNVICAKPVGTTIEECERMIRAAKEAGVQLLQGHSKVMDAPIRAMRDAITSGELGQVLQVDTWLFNDWLQRPRLEEELDPSQGGGIVLRQGPHQVDIVRYLAGGKATSLSARVARGDPDFPADGNYAVAMDFEGGATASMVLNGYGYFESTELTWNIGSMGDIRPSARGKKLKIRRTGALDVSEKYGAAALDVPALTRKQGDKMPFFGLTIVSCERGVIRQSPDGLLIYSAAGCEERTVGPHLGRAAELMEMRDALVDGRDVFPGGPWGKATLEACLAIMQSSRERRPIPLLQQTPCP